jgi:hypothetical protein
MVAFHCPPLSPTVISVRFWLGAANDLLSQQQPLTK